MGRGMKVLWARKYEVTAEGLRLDQLRLADAELGSCVELPAVAVKHRRLTRTPLSRPAVALLRWMPQRRSCRFGSAGLVFAGRGN
jgi:hypothetical protein